MSKFLRLFERFVDDSNYDSQTQYKIKSFLKDTHIFRDGQKKKNHTPNKPEMCQAKSTTRFEDKDGLSDWPC